MPRGKISLLVSVRKRPQDSTMIVDFLVVDCLSAYNEIIGRPRLKALNNFDLSLINQVSNH